MGRVGCFLSDFNVFNVFFSLFFYQFKRELLTGFYIFKVYWMFKIKFSKSTRWFTIENISLKKDKTQITQKNQLLGGFFSTKILLCLVIGFFFPTLLYKNIYQIVIIINRLLSSSVIDLIIDWWLFFRFMVIVVNQSLEVETRYPYFTAKPRPKIPFGLGLNHLIMRVGLNQGYIFTCG